MRIAKLYQVSDFDKSNAMMLCDWIMENYKYDNIDDVLRCLEYPPAPKNDDRNFRLTPDTVAHWMTDVLLTRSIEREREYSKFKALQAQSEEEPADDETAKKYIKELMTNIQNSQTKRIPRERRIDELANDPGFKKFREEYSKSKDKNADTKQ